MEVQQIAENFMQCSSEVGDSWFEFSDSVNYEK